jgi:RNA polymerase sigma factor (sigma-70 family)
VNIDQEGHNYFELSHETFLIGKQSDEERTKKILEAVNQLPARQKEIIYLRIYKGLSYEEISQVMQLNYQVVRNLLSQALKSFRKIIAPVVS